MHFEVGEMEVKMNDASNEKFKFEQCDLPKTSAILLKMETQRCYISTLRDVCMKDALSNITNSKMINELFLLRLQAMP